MEFILFIGLASGVFVVLGVISDYILPFFMREKDE